MTNDMIKKHVGKKCKIIASGSLGATLIGEII